MWSQKGDDVNRNHEDANYLHVLGALQANRGLRKSQYTPAEQGLNLNPLDPDKFGVQERMPIPYERIFNSSQNIVRVMQGMSTNSDDR
jgi:hypothetical protein